MTSFSNSSIKSDRKKKGEDSKPLFAISAAKIFFKGDFLKKGN